MFAVAATGLLLTGHTSLRASSDKEAVPVAMLTIGVAFAVAMLLIRYLPARLPVLAVETGARERAALTRQVTVLLAAGGGFALLAGLVPLGDLYHLVKPVVLLGGVAIALLAWRVPSPVAAHRRQIPALWYWAGPLAAVAAWMLLFYAGPAAAPLGDLSEYRKIDQVELAVIMTITFLTASVTEEVFYRIVFQTRLEALWGRWPAIVASALLFAVMHSARLGTGSFWVMLGTIVVWQGSTGLLLGYLWSRYRNRWAVIVLHGLQNAFLGLVVLFT